MNIVLITGCSSGFGFLTALKFSRNGWQVLAAVREKNDGARQLEKIAEQEKLPLEIVLMDVTQPQQITQQVTAMLKKYGKIDVLINNAGYGLLGPVEEFSTAEIQKLYEVNIFGPIRMIQAVLPSMRQHHHGRIINLSSVCGLLSFALYGIYSSSKFAVEAISEALRFEVKPFGVDVTMLEPGAFATNFNQNSQHSQKHVSTETVYDKLQHPIDDQESPGPSLKTHPIIKKLTNPQRVADKLFEIANASSTRIRYQIGVDTRFYTFLRKILPDQLWEALFHWVYKY